MISENSIKINMHSNTYLCIQYNLLPAFLYHWDKGHMMWLYFRVEMYQCYTWYTVELYWQNMLLADRRL